MGANTVIDRVAYASTTKGKGAIVEFRILVAVDAAVVDREVSTALDRHDSGHVPPTEPAIRLRKWQIVNEAGHQAMLDVVVRRTVVKVRVHAIGRIAVSTEVLRREGVADVVHTLRI